MFYRYAETFDWEERGMLFYKLQKYNIVGKIYES